MKNRDSQPLKKFLPLSAVSRLQLSRSSLPPDPVSSSFACPPRADPIVRLPDIYTTCPELIQFKPFLDCSSSKRSLNFDPNDHILRPVDLGFLPKSEWMPDQLSLWDLRQMYFTRRNGIARQFEYKLYNALLITSAFPESYEFVGAIWVNERVMKIHAAAFANLLGIHAVQGGLFHKQGNFSRHAFHHVFKISSPELAKMPECAEVDDYQIRLYTDQLGRFVRGVELRLML
jgi:hypothetical protein